MPNQSEWFLFYGVQLSNPVLRTLRPLKRCTVFVKDAHLSFSHPGIPFLEPCYPTAVVRGVNDQGFDWAQGLSREEEYRRWLWKICSPGIGEFFGDGVPLLEGIAMLLPQETVKQLTSSQGFHSSTIAHVECTPFEEADKEKIIGESFKATTLILPSVARSKDEAIPPSTKIFRQILVPSVASGLSINFVSHLVLIRPAPQPSVLQRVSMTLLLITPFFTLFLPLHIIQSLLRVTLEILGYFRMTRFMDVQKCVLRLLQSVQVAKKEVSHWSWTWIGWCEGLIPRPKQDVNVGSGI